MQANLPSTAQQQLLSSGAASGEILGAPAAVTTVWETVAQTIWGSYVTEVERRAIMQGAALAGALGSALEIGCEGGRWSKMLADRGWQMTCVDINAEVLSICQARIPGARCLLTEPTAKRIPCDSNSFSLLLCIEVAAVMQSDWFLSEAHRLLTPQGILVSVCWNKFSWRGLQAHLRFRLSHNANSDFYSRSYPAWRNLLSRTGFQILSQEGFCWGPFRRASNSPVIPTFIRFERLLRLYRMPTISPWIVVIARKK